MAREVGRLSRALCDARVLSHTSASAGVVVAVGVQAAGARVADVGCEIDSNAARLAADKKIGGAMFVAGWFDVDKPWETLRPWIETEIDYKAVKATTSNFKTIISTNDQYTSNYELNRKLWKERIDATVVVVKSGQHFNASEEPVVLEELLTLVGN